jgi:hypothetical protein
VHVLEHVQRHAHLVQQEELYQNQQPQDLNLLLRLPNLLLRLPNLLLRLPNLLLVNHRLVNNLVKQEITWAQQQVLFHTVNKVHTARAAVMVVR